MSTFLIDSMARDHAAAMQANAIAARRARALRQEIREVRRAERRLRRNAAHPRATAVGHAAARPFTAVHNWLLAGQL